MKRTFVMIKQNVIERPLVGEIIKIIEKRLKIYWFYFENFSNNSNNWQWKCSWRKT